MPTPVVLFGAGHDALPMVAIGKQMGWHVTVADGRANYATATRLPQADRVVMLDLRDPRDPLRGIRVTPGTMAVLMTHNYPLCLRLLRPICAANPLGPKSRKAETRGDLKVAAR